MTEHYLFSTGVHLTPLPMVALELLSSVTEILACLRKYATEQFCRLDNKMVVMLIQCAATLPAVQSTTLWRLVPVFKQDLAIT